MINFNDPQHKKSPIQTSLMTSLGLIQGEILGILEKRMWATQEQVIENLNWPSILITMSIGALVREGLIQAKTVDGRLLLIESTVAKEKKKNRRRSDKPSGISVTSAA